jgi:hypothetical protein
MMLINKITKQDVEYLDEYITSLKINVANKLITKIVIFHENTNINLPKNNKVILVNKTGYTSHDIIEYSKRLYDSKLIIFANPFCIFNHTLLKALTNRDSNKAILLSSCVDGIINTNSLDVCIFNKKTKIINSKNNDIRSTFQTGINLSKDIIVENKRPWIENNHDDKIEVDSKITQTLITPSNKPVIERKVGIKIDRAINTINKTYRNRKIDIIIVSVNYNDYLLVTLSNNIKYHYNITVVTSEDDLLCHKICDNFNVKCVVSDRIYENGAKFNKGKAINDGIRTINNPDFILILDADIVLTERIDMSSLCDDSNILYYTSRYICGEYNTYEKWVNKKIELQNIGKYENKIGLGFFQLFKYCPDKKYPENFTDAGWSDLIFRDTFIHKEKIEESVIHLGDPMVNWKGRISDRFINEQEFSKLLNTKTSIYRIGIGITTHNRSHIISKTISNIVTNTSCGGIKYILVDDNSDNNHRSENEKIAKKYNISYHYNKENLGIAKSKNKCLEYIDDCDYIFLFDDDCYPIRDNWWDKFIEASEETNCEHFSLTFDHTSSGRPNGNKLLGKINKNKFIIEEYSNPCGILLFMTKNCIEKIGGFDSNYGLYGKEHVGYSMRCHNLGLTIGNFLSVSNTLEYFYSYDYESKIPSALPWDVKQESRAINEIVFIDEKQSYDYKPYKKMDVCITYIDSEIDIVNINNFDSSEINIIIHHNLSPEYVRINTNEKIKFYKVNTLDKNKAYTEFVEKNKIYLNRFRLFDDNIKNNIILSTIITGVDDLQRNIKWEDDNFDYIKDWYYSIIKNNLNAVVFHNTFSDETIKKYSNKNVSFIYVNYDGYLNPNVYRYFLYKKYIENNLDKINNVVITDITDVVIIKNPFDSEFFKSNTGHIFCGDEETTLNSDWMRKHNEHLRNNIPGFNEYEKQNANKKLLNCGIIGGSVFIIKELLDRICEVHEKVTITNKTNYTCDMGVFNYIIRTKYNELVLHGTPINTKFKYFEVNNNSCWFRHK